MEKLRIRFILKNGMEIPILCDKIDLSQSNLTGELSEYHATGVVYPRPMFIKLDEVVAVINDGLMGDVEIND